jgi:hypothetical protein
MIAFLIIFTFYFFNCVLFFVFFFLIVYIMLVNFLVNLIIFINCIKVIKIDLFLKNKKIQFNYSKFIYIFFKELKT